MKKDILKAASLLSQVGISMLVPIVMCVFIGRWLDSFFGTGGILLIVFILLGIGSGFKCVYDLTKSFCKDKNDREYRFAHPEKYGGDEEISNTGNDESEE